jgi:hypothetical protein
VAAGYYTPFPFTDGTASRARRLPIPIVAHISVFHREPTATLLHNVLLEVFMSRHLASSHPTYRDMRGHLLEEAVFHPYIPLTGTVKRFQSLISVLKGLNM